MKVTMNIDEINAYANEDGTFQVEIHTYGEQGPITLTVPRAALELNLNVAHRFEDGLEIILRGVVS